MPVVDLLAPLVAGELDLVGVRHDHIVPNVSVRRPDGLVLAGEQHGDGLRNPSDRQSSSVDVIPIPPVCARPLRVSCVSLSRSPKGRHRNARERAGAS